MEILYFLIPIALVLAGLLVLALWWAIRSGQYDDLEGPAYSILMDDDETATTDAIKAGHEEKPFTKKEEAGSETARPPGR